MSSSRIYYSHEAEAKAIRRITMLTVIWLAFGLAVGAVLALIFAPASSKSIRKTLSKSIEEGLYNSQEAIEPVVKKLEKEVGELRQSLEERIAKMK